jgi:methionyl-tRNA formyltransferase
MENKKKLIVNVVDGIIYINEIHLEGKKSLKISDFLNGFKVPENSYFS